MTPTQFIQWLSDMKTSGIAKNQRACAKLLGVRDTSIVRFKQAGCSKTVALACTALLAVLQPSR